MQKAKKPISKRRRRKQRVKTYLQTRDIESLLALLHNDPNVPSTLVSFLSTRDDLLRWRAIESLGVLAAELANEDIDLVRNIIRRQFWSMNDESGGIAWHSPEAIGEVLTQVPQLIPEYQSILSSFSTIYPFEGGVQWALYRIASIRPDLALGDTEQLLRALQSELPTVRGFAAATLMLHKYQYPSLDRLQSDGASLQMYDFRSGQMKATTVAEMAQATSTPGRTAIEYDQVIVMR
jgi:methylated-DNA-[protein]-cysteine S-methyltransferase